MPLRAWQPQLLPLVATHLYVTVYTAKSLGNIVLPVWRGNWKGKHKSKIQTLCVAVHDWANVYLLEIIRPGGTRKVDDKLQNWLNWLRDFCEKISVTDRTFVVGNRWESLLKEIFCDLLTQSGYKHLAEHLHSNLKRLDHDYLKLMREPSSDENRGLRLIAAIESLWEVERLARNELGWNDDPPTITKNGQLPSLKSYIPTVCTALAELGITAEAKGLHVDAQASERCKEDMLLRIAYGSAPEEEYDLMVGFFGPFERLPDDPEESAEIIFLLRVEFESKINFVCHRVQRLIEFLERESSDDKAQGATNPATSNECIFAPVEKGYSISAFGEAGYVDNLKGFDQLFMLLTQQGTPVSMLSLIQGKPVTTTNVDPLSEGLEVFQPSLQETLDAEAKSEYRKKMLELRQTIEEAKGDGNALMEREATNEMDQLLLQLKKDIGIKGRSRDLNSENEKRRPTIISNLKRAYNKLRKVRPPLGKLADHLELYIRSESGNFIYEPPEKDSISWTFSSPSEK